jgi:hypothetical protein
VVSGSGQKAVVNTGYGAPLVAKVIDAHGKPVAGITVVFELPAGASGTFAGSAVVVTSAAGLATSPALTANTVAGKFTIDAWVAGVAVPAAFALTNTAGTPFQVKAVAGSEQSATVGKTFATHLEAEVVDQFGNPVSGVTVTFNAPTSGAGGTFAGKTSSTAVTGSTGIATAPTFTANAQTGSYSVTTIVSGVSANNETSFSLTNDVAALVRLAALRDARSGDAANVLAAALAQVFGEGFNSVF